MLGVLVDKAYAQSAKIYKSWEDFSQGYLIGRAMWSGNSMSLSNISSIIKDLLEEERSPWKKVSLK